MNHYTWERDQQARVQRWQEKARKREGLQGIPEEALEEMVFQIVTNLGGLGTELSTFAEATCGDTKLLNYDTPLGKFVLSQLAGEEGVPVPSSAEQSRALWRRFGVYADALSSRVLTVGLRPTRADGLSSKLLAWLDSPSVITYHELERASLEFGAQHVYCFENPAVLVRVLHLCGKDLPPMVCGSGWLSNAAYELLDQVVGTGGKVLYHGDFDWPGVQIALSLAARYGDSFSPWRFDAEHYREAVAAAAGTAFAVELEGKPPKDEAGVLTELIEAMVELGRAISEEAVIDSVADAVCRDAARLTSYEERAAAERSGARP